MLSSYIKVENSKLENMKEFLWCKQENIYICVPVEFDGEKKKKYKDGFLLISNGAIYLFESKFLKQPNLIQRFHILHIKNLRIDLTNIEFNLDNFSIDIKTQYVIQIYQAIQTILLGISYGLQLENNFTIESSITLPQITIDSRPQNNIHNRVIFFAHYYSIRGDYTTLTQYFDKWEQKPSSMFVFGSSFSPGNMAQTIGHAIAWESTLDTIVFQYNTSSHFSELFQSILENSKTIKKIAFTDYKSDTTLPKFPQQQISNTTVKKYWFMRCKAQLINDFCSFAKFLPSNVEDFTLNGSQLTEEEMMNIVKKIGKSVPLKNMNSLSILRMKMNPFPFDAFMKLIRTADNLTTLTIRGLDSNASDLFTAICSVQNRIKILNITHMQFRSQIIENINLPPALIRINFSFCAFISVSFQSLMKLLISTPKLMPFALQMQCLVIKPISYASLEGINLKNVYPNISEIDWSGNSIPAKESIFLFAYLFTQKRLLHLKFENINPDNPMEFLQNFVTLIASLRIPGVDLSGRFEQTHLIQFMEALSYMGWLRRISLRNSLTGEEGISMMHEILRKNTKINELNIDGFNCTKFQNLINLWSTINNSPHIVATDFPSNDMKRLKKVAADLTPNERSIMEAVMQRNRTSTCEHRSMYIIEQMNVISEQDLDLDNYEFVAQQFYKIVSHKIFRQTVEMGFMDIADDTDNESGSNKPNNIEEA